MSREHDDTSSPASPVESPAAVASTQTPNHETASDGAAERATTVAVAEEPSTDSATHTVSVSNDGDQPAPPPAVPFLEQSLDGSASSDGAAAEAESREGMEKLIEQYAVPQATPAEGEIFDGHVIAVNDAGVVVDVGGKFEGLVPAEEFLETGGAIPFGPGQTIEVERLHEQKDGYVLLSHVRAHRRRIWEKIDKAYREHQTITGKVIERIKGGVVVDIGVRSFLPASQIELRPVHDLEAWKDREIELRVLKLNRKRGNVVVSRRALLEETAKAQREALVSSLSEGSVVKGKVKNITDYGVFVDLGGVDGLLHITDLAWGRVKHPSEIVKTGDEIEVKVLRFDQAKSRISLGRKQLLPDPWAAVPERCPVGTRIHAKVVGVTDYGAFVQIEPGVEGLVHVSEMSWSRRVKHPSKMVKVGDEVDVVVLELKPDSQRISLGLKQTLPDPWEAAADRFPVGSIINGRVRSLTDFGAFVEIEDGLEGLIHISDISWTERVKHPSEKFKKGDNVEAKVLKVDAENRRLSLGIKQVNDIWANWFAAHHVNEVIKGKVVRTTDFGAFVELADGIEALCHVSEIEDRRPKGEREKQPRKDRASSLLNVGQEYEFKIIRMDPEQRKIGLSYRAAQKQAERQEMESFRSSKSSPTATIGDAILAKRQSS
ncbi:MAG TPA: 30S ribosomal protein S1 [Candidatus Acidoferrales bacterium]|nr:30S ribosomal protein S1 [Candidatus Acidoferrales bacterium]